MQNQDEFVIRTSFLQYVALQGFTTQIEKAMRFSSRMAALGECSRRGAILHQAAIVPYMPQERPGGLSAEKHTDEMLWTRQWPAESRGTGDK